MWFFSLFIFILFFLSSTIHACDYRVTPSTLSNLLSSQNTFSKSLTVVCFEAGEYVLQPKTIIYKSMQWHGPCGKDSTDCASEAILTTTPGTVALHSQSSAVMLEIAGFTLKTPKGATLISMANHNSILYNNIYIPSKTRSFFDVPSNNEDNSNENNTTTSTSTSGGQVPTTTSGLVGVVMIRIVTSVNGDVTLFNLEQYKETLQRRFGSSFSIEAYLNTATSQENFVVTTEVKGEQSAMSQVSQSEVENESRLSIQIQHSSFSVVDVSSERIYSSTSSDDEGGISTKMIIIIVCASVGGVLLIAIVGFLGYRYYKKKNTTYTHVMGVRLSTVL